MPTERRLAAIMFTDIVGYKALMAESEEKGLRARERHRALVRPLVEKYHGSAPPHRVPGELTELELGHRLSLGLPGALPAATGAETFIALGDYPQTR